VSIVRVVYDGIHFTSIFYVFVRDSVPSRVGRSQQLVLLLRGRGVSGCV